MIFPEAQWRLVDSAAGDYPADLVGRALQAAAESGSIAAAIVHRGRVVAWSGDPNRKVLIRSIRKSLLGALIGIEVERKRIDLRATMAELDIDDVAPSLTALEKQATVADLLKARSGIYHPALAESAEMKATKPERGAHPPGTFWNYNNWDFNALGTIYERATGRSVFEGFRTEIAEPIGMRDFETRDGAYLRGAESEHPAYHFHLTLFDLARFGHLILNRGCWNGRQIVPAAWVSESVTAHSITPRGGGYGYMWWTTGLDGRAQRNTRIGAQLPAVRYFAHGHYGQALGIMPERHLVIVNFATSREKTPQEQARFDDFVLLSSKAVA